jgi:hypothetical protein
MSNANHDRLRQLENALDRFSERTLRIPGRYAKDMVACADPANVRRVRMTRFFALHEMSVTFFTNAHPQAAVSGDRLRRRLIPSPVNSGGSEGAGRHGDNLG